MGQKASCSAAAAAAAAAAHARGCFERTGKWRGTSRAPRALSCASTAAQYGHSKSA